MFPLPISAGIHPAIHFRPRHPSVADSIMSEIMDGFAPEDIFCDVDFSVVNRKEADNVTGDETSGPDDCDSYLVIVPDISSTFLSTIIADEENRHAIECLNNLSIISDIISHARIYSELENFIEMFEVDIQQDPDSETPYFVTDEFVDKFFPIWSRTIEMENITDGPYKKRTLQIYENYRSCVDSFQWFSRETSATIVVNPFEDKHVEASEALIDDPINRAFDSGYTLYSACIPVTKDTRKIVVNYARAFIKSIVLAQQIIQEFSND